MRDIAQHARAQRVLSIAMRLRRSVVSVSVAPTR
jgi:hypothetical protein